MDLRVRFQLRVLLQSAAVLMTVAAASAEQVASASASPAVDDTTKDCHIGSYRLDDGRAVDIAPSDGDTLRWRTFSGETGQLHPEKCGTWASTYGWTDRPDGKNVSFSLRRRRDHF